MVDVSQVAADQAGHRCGGDLEQAAAIAREAGWLKIGKSGKVLRNRERLDLESKLERLNLAIPWD